MEKYENTVVSFFRQHFLVKHDGDKDFVVAMLLSTAKRGR